MTKMTEAGPRISVVIFTYNHEQYIGECIESILAQTLRPFEIFIVDDCSTDCTWEIVSKYAQDYPDLIRAHRHKKNMGQELNGNYGKKNVRGDLFAYIDGDDRWLPRKLEMEWKALQRNPDARIAYSNVYTIDAAGNRTGIWYDGQGPEPPSGDIFIETFARRIFPNTRSVFRNQLMYCSALAEVGYNDLSLESYWDWDEKIRLVARFPVVYSGEALVEYRQHEGGFSKSDPAKHFRAFVKVYEKHLPLLERRIKAEAARVKCNIESLIALRQVRLPVSEHLDYYSVHNVYRRSRRLLDELLKSDRAALEKELAPLFAQLARQLTREALGSGNRKLALKYWLESLRYTPRRSDIELATQVMLPRWAYQTLKPLYHDLRSLLR